IVLKIEVRVGLVIEVLTKPLPIKINPKVVADAPAYQLLLRMRLRVIAHIAAFEVCVEPSRETHVRAVILCLAISVQTVIEMATVAVVPDLISQTIARAIVAVGLARPRWIRRCRIVTNEATVG